MDKRTLLFIALVLACLVFIASTQAGILDKTKSAGTKITGSGGYYKNERYGEVYWILKRILYAELSLEVARDHMDYFTGDVEGMIMLNPDPRSPEIMNALSSFIKLVLPFYILGIVVTGFYVIFMISAPRGRAKAKMFLKDLVIGMIFVSLSPVILNVMIMFSEIVTAGVLSQTDPQIVGDNMEDVLGGFTCPFCIFHTLVTMVEIELGYYTFIPFLLVAWGTVILFFIRFGVIVIWMIIFPLSMLLYSFDTTRGVGRNMLEQTIIWIYLQVFNAVIVVAVALSLLQKNENMLGFMEIQMIPNEIGGLSLPLFEMISASSVFFDIIPFIGCMGLLFAPLLVIRLFKGFLP